MNTALIQDILIHDRIRTAFDKETIKDLADSIENFGLFHLPIVRKEGNQLVLVAGERRIRAMQEIWARESTFSYAGNPRLPYTVPYLLFSDLSPEEALEVELEENIKRADLSWQDRARAIDKLHKFRTDHNPKHRMMDTAEELTGSPDGSTRIVRDRILLAENLDRPAVAKAKTEKDALKILKREMEEEFSTILGERHRSNLKATKHILFLGDAIEELKNMKEKSVDVVLTDPPYGIDAHKFDANMEVKHIYKDNWAYVSELLLKLIPEITRVTKDKAHVYLFCSIEKFFEIKKFFEAYLWDVWPRPLIWVKDIGHIPKPHYGPRYNYEVILYANKGERPVTALYSDVLTVPSVKGQSHAAQKPVELFVQLLRRSCVPGDLILDPFCGSGTIFPAANILNLKAVGFDSDEAAIGLASGRLEGKE